MRPRPLVASPVARLVLTLGILLGVVGSAESVMADDTCVYAFDGQCDEHAACDRGTDSTDCSQAQLNSSSEAGWLATLSDLHGLAAATILANAAILGLGLLLFFAAIPGGRLLATGLVLLGLPTVLSALSPTVASAFPFHSHEAAIRLVAVLSVVVGVLIAVSSGRFKRIAGEAELSEASFEVPRNNTNSVSRAEAIRDRLYDAFEQARQRLGVRAEGFRSRPFEPTTWLRIDIQEPVLEHDFGDEAQAEEARRQLELDPNAESVLERDFDDEAQAEEARRQLELDPNAELFRFEPTASALPVEDETDEPKRASESVFLRSQIAVVIEAKDFYRFEHELRLTIDDGKRTRHFAQVIDLTTEDFAKILLYLSGRSPQLRWKPRRFRLFPWQLSRPDNKLRGIVPDDNWPAIVAFAAGLLSIEAYPLFGVLGIVAALAIWSLSPRRRVHRLTQGKPEQEPRRLVRMDSWHAVVYDLASQADHVAKQIVKDLSASEALAWQPTQRGVEGRTSVSEEPIWYEGLDGKVERRQIVVRLRRALAFVHVYAYGTDLFVGWDAHVNAGTWAEKLVGEGVEPKSGRLVRAYGVAASWRTPNEYDLLDANFLIEWAHSVVSRVVKGALRTHQIDQEIDFTIVREARQRVTEAKEPKEAKPRRGALRRIG